MEENPIWGADWHEVRALWRLDPRVAHCNHGSFGAVPGPVSDVQDGFRRRMVANPMRWFHREMPDLLLEARAEVAAFLGAEPAGVAFVTNVSSGMSAVLQSLSFWTGAEILSTDHAYGAVSLALDRFCERTGTARVIAPVPVAATDDEIVAALADHCTDRTALVVIDQITSATARRFPVRRIAALAHEAGAAIAVDGAHAPGMLPVNVPALGVDFWVGNLHKWPCAPAGTAALWVAPEYRDRIRPLVVSHADRAGFPDSFDRMGTNDLSAWLAAPHALRLFAGLGWERVRAHNEKLVRCGQSIVAEVLGVPTAGLRADPGVSMATVPLPTGVADTPAQASALQEHLVDAGVEAVTPGWQGRGTIRLSAQVYNGPADYERLAHGVRDFMTR